MATPKDPVEPSYSPEELKALTLRAFRQLQPYLDFRNLPSQGYLRPGPGPWTFFQNEGFQIHNFLLLRPPGDYPPEDYPYLPSENPTKNDIGPDQETEEPDDYNIYKRGFFFKLKWEHNWFGKLLNRAPSVVVTVTHPRLMPKFTLAAAKAGMRGHDLPLRQDGKSRMGLAKRFSRS